MIVALLFGVAGQILIAQSFETALRFRVQAAVADYSALASAMEAELYGIYLYYNTASPEMYGEILKRAGSNQGVESPCAIYGTDGTLITASTEDFPETLAFTELRVRRFAYRLLRDGERTMLDTAGCVSIGGQNYFLSVRYDATDLMRLRAEQIESVTMLHLITVALSTAAMLLVSYFTTKPLRRLKRFTEVIGGGNYSRRARVTTLDEIGDLTVAFNDMTGAIEQKVDALELNAKQQKDFVASFSHELKTPMTSIIGYADMLRSTELDEEDAFMAANFIFSEGKRLEAMSLKLMDLVVLDKNEFKLVRGYARRALGHVVAVVTPMLEKAELTLQYDIEQQIILYEKDLLLTLVTNLIDNARKASSPGKTITLTGRREAGRYRISVRDEGIGIPAEEISRITEAFFMVDKSRSRAQHGAGLGLAISNRIAQIHGSTLHFESEVNKGTLVWFDVPLYARGKGGDAE
ncbi:MAG: HAMP domain-containing histidine kinase [Clostridia bacterium]|nr:HAMP domain-containing histidine kinase [Clostridia bacterium]